MSTEKKEKAGLSELPELKREKLTEGISFHEFKPKEPFVCTFTGETKENPKTQKPMGHIVEDEFGNEMMVPYCYVINKAFEKCEPGDLVEIIFLEKKTTKNGQSVNVFDVYKLS